MIPFHFNFSEPIRNALSRKNRKIRLNLLTGTIVKLLNDITLNEKRQKALGIKVSSASHKNGYLSSTKMSEFTEKNSKY